jgi:hypothetical protein
MKYCPKNPNVMKWYFTMAAFVFAFFTTNAQVFVNQSAMGSNDGTSWANAFIDLQQAIDASPPGAQIWIAAGVYKPQGPTPDSSHFISLKPLEIYGGFAGTESTPTERDWQNNQTILSGDISNDDVQGDFENYRSDNAHHILIVNAPQGQTIIDGLIIEGGITRLDPLNTDASDIPYNRWRGGGLYIFKSTSIVRNCRFHDNYGTQGSAFFAAGDTSQSSVLEMENCIFELNSSITAAACWLSSWQDAEIRQCVFQNNEAGSNGAGLVLGNMNATLEECSIDQNYSANQGGGCLIFNNAFSLIPHPVYLFNKCGFTENSALIAGGAVRLNNFFSSFSLSFDSCSFDRNFTTNSYGSGGAVHLVDYADETFIELPSLVRFSHCSFAENAGGYGGAVELDFGDDSIRVEVTYSGFSGNTATDSGGGLYLWMVDSSEVHTQIDRTTFNENKAAVGGALILDSYYNIERMTYSIDSCDFSNNEASIFGGAIGQFRTEGPGLIGSIRNSRFLNNEALQAGALISRQETLELENCLFTGNYAAGYDSDPTGGGAFILVGPGDVTVRNSIFEKNISDVEGAAIFNAPDVNARFENVLFQENQGLSTLVNDGNLYLVNATIANNEYGLLLLDSSLTEIQNSVFNNSSENLRTEGKPEVISNGSNISSDGTMAAMLTGSGNYDDLHNTDPLLGPDFVPVSGSPCIDAGNPQGIKFPFDLAGNPRLHGGAIDIGSYESFLVATQDALWNVPAFNVYPNPVKDVLHFDLEMDWIGDINLVIYNYAGQPLQRENLVKSTTRQSFDENIQHLSAGEYVVMIVVGANTYATNIVIQK